MAQRLYIEKILILDLWETIASSYIYIGEGTEDWFATRSGKHRYVPNSRVYKNILYI